MKMTYMVKKLRIAIPRRLFHVNLLTNFAINEGILVNEPVM